MSSKVLRSMDLRECTCTAGKNKNLAADCHLYSIYFFVLVSQFFQQSEIVLCYRRKP